ncbi:helicase HerA domain-containing protein [Geodermatophilus sp. SYSU D00758]
MSLWTKRPIIPLGFRRIFPLVELPLSITTKQALSHMHVIGKTGSGKSYFLLGLCLAFLEAGLPFTLIDPHGTLSKLLLAHLIQAGYYRNAAMYDRLIFLDIPSAMDAKRYLPFNFLDQPYEDHAVGEFVTDAFKRAYPELSVGAPTFTNLVKHSIIVLRQNRLPITALADLLTDQAYRMQLLGQVTDPQVIRYFTMRFDKWGRDEADKKESTLNRVDDLTYAPFMRYSLGNPINSLNFRSIIDAGQSMVVNLSVPEYPEASQLFGCLFTVGMEQAAKSRSRLDEGEVDRLPSHHLVIDEFQRFTKKDQGSFSDILSETRKYRLFSILSHQNWSQADERLKGALENVGFEVIFKAGRKDATYSAEQVGAVNPMLVKHEIPSSAGGQRTHPAYLQLQEQWELHRQGIQYLKRGHAVVTLPDDRQYRIRTRTLPRLTVGKEAVATVREEYLRRYFVPAPAFPVAGKPAVPVPAGISRRPPAAPVSLYEASEEPT